MNIFWAYNVELNNFHLFQQKFMPILQDSDVSCFMFISRSDLVLVIVFLQTVIEVIY